MKTRWIFILAFLVAAVSAKAQDGGLKIGYTNAEYILSNMPEAKQIEADLKDYEQQLSTQLESKSKDFQAKLTHIAKWRAEHSDEHWYVAYQSCGDMLNFFHS